MKTQILKNSLTSIILLCSLFIFTANSQTKSLNITVYNEDLGVIREVRSVELDKGISELQFTDVAERIDPTSVKINMNGIVLEQNYRYDLVNMGKILQRFIDKEITLTSENAIITGKLLSAGSQIVLQNEYGGLTMLPSIDKFQIQVEKLPEGLITRPTLVWLLNAEKSGKQDVELSYQTGGMSWNAEYVAVLNQKSSKMSLNSWVSVQNNSGATFKDAKLKLVAGDINRIDNMWYSSKEIRVDGVRDFASYEDAFEQRELFDYYIYELQRPTTLADKETKQVSLFQAENLNYKTIYSTNIPNNNVDVNIEFENTEKNNLGRPLPAGKVRVMTEDNGSLEFIGENYIRHTPKNEKININIGKAFDLVAEHQLIKNIPISKDVFEEEHVSILKNRKKEEVTIEVTKSIYSSRNQKIEILESSHKYEWKNAQTLIFKIPVKADEDVTLKFKTRVVTI